MKPTARFSYVCHQCGHCCRDQVIALSPYDLIRIARAAGLSTAAARERFTRRRGSILRFDHRGACSALIDTTCSLHSGRPLACRLYPLGMQHNADETASFFRLEPALGSRGVYGTAGAITDFLRDQGVPAYLEALSAYRALLPLMRARLDQRVNFDHVEPREFWRVATREALAEENFDPNPLIDVLYDPDGLGCVNSPPSATVPAHIAALRDLIMDTGGAAVIAAAGVLLAVSLGYTPAAFCAAPALG